MPSYHVACSNGSSNLTRPIIASTGSTTAPVAGDTVSLSWSGGPTSTKTYQWKTATAVTANIPAGTLYSIPGKTNATYVLTNADLGTGTRYIYCTVTAGGCTMNSTLTGAYTTGTNGSA